MAVVSAAARAQLKRAACSNPNARRWAYSSRSVSSRAIAVSYTHLDVYKRQRPTRAVADTSPTRWRKFASRKS